MKMIKTLITIIFLGTITAVHAQGSSVESETKITYYQQRGTEDAKFELSFQGKTKAEETAFWKEQKAYEKELKKKNRKAYRAYIASKKETYAAHHYDCDAHCHHSNAFYTQARYYYYGYDDPGYQRTPTRTSVNAQIGVRTPSVRLGL